MLRVVVFFFVVFSVSFSAHADTSNFEGLYYPPGDPSGDWSCKLEDIGQYGGALGVKEDVLHGTEWACWLSNPKEVEDGTQYFGECWGEPGEFRDIITLRNTEDGLLVTTEDGAGEWLTCEDENAARQSKWSISDQGGASQTSILNDRNEYVNFSCGYATPFQFNSIHISSQYQFDGNVAFVIDGQAFSFSAENSSISIEPNCVECMRNYSSFMKQLFEGKSMTLVSETGSTLAFDVRGAREAFFDEMCLDAEFFVGADKVKCKLSVDRKVIHYGKCSFIEEDTSISFYTIGSIEFFIPLHLDDDKTKATGYWNGPTGGTHAHADLGEMRLVGNCWQNDRNSICIVE